MAPTPLTSSLASRSTGPRTTTGKAASSRNALRHGLASSTLLMPGEDAAAYEALLADLTAEWRPETATERLLVQSMAKHHWLAERALRLQSEALAISQPGELPPTFALLLRYQTTNERAFALAFRTLEAMRKSRRQFVSQNQKQTAHASKNAMWANLSKPFPKFDYADYLKQQAEAPANQPEPPR